MNYFILIFGVLQPDLSQLKKLHTKLCSLNNILIIQFFSVHHQ